MNILIVGAKGQLGSELNSILKKGTTTLGDLPLDYLNSNITLIDYDVLDIGSLEMVKKYFNANKFDIVINCAAYTNVNKCESDIDNAYRVNALGAKHLSQACSKIGAKFVHISTDYVFSGDVNKPYHEYDLKNPQSVYGYTKHIGEEYVREFCSKYFIFRTSWLYGYNGNNFVKTIIKTGIQKGELKVVNDQTGNPTNSLDLAYHILKAAVTDHYGIYHCTGNGECTRYDFACKIIEYAGIDCKIYPCATEEYPSPAKRPSNSSLDNMMLRLTVGDEMREWQVALKEYIENLDINNL